MSIDINLNYKPRKWQVECHRVKARFKVIALHRRGGKTVFATMELIDKALKFDQDLGLFVFVAPFLSQAKAIESVIHTEKVLRFAPIPVVRGKKLACI